MTIGEKISPILQEICYTLLEYDASPKAGKYGFDNMDLFAATKIFASCILDKMYELQLKEKMSMENASDMAVKLGNEIRNLVKIYTDIDLHELAKQ